MITLSCISVPNPRHCQTYSDRKGKAPEFMTAHFTRRFGPLMMMMMMLLLLLSLHARAAQDGAGWLMRVMHRC